MIQDLIFGKDKTEGIVNITLKNDQLYLYTESVNGDIEVEQFPYTPWVLSPNKLKSYSERLKGDQYYKYITSTTTEKFLNLQKDFVRGIWIPRSINECFMLCEGATYFKNRRVEDISILSFDIETSGLKMNSDSKVFLISNTFRKKGQVIRKLFALDDYNNNELDLIQSWVDWVQEINPSIICGHNILSYDLPYLSHCYKRWTNHDLPIGRDGSEIYYNEKVSKMRKDGTQQYEYHDAKIMGREIIDTFFLSLKYDIGRNFISYGLKSIIRQLGLEKTDRSFIDAAKISQYYNNREQDPETWLKVKQYAEDDSEDSLKLYDLMIPSYFYLAQSIPKTFQQMINEATGSHIDGLMIRSYLQNGYSQPMTSGKVPFEGAISMGRPGVYEHVRKADIASLYPSIMMQYNIHDPEKDPNNHMIAILSYFRDQRLANKKLAKETGDRYYDDMQNAQKILINSMYGFLGANFLLYNYPEGAADVTKYGREILLKGVVWATGHTLQKTIKKIVNEGKENEEIQYEWTIGEKIAEGRGYTLVNVDTDSFSITNGLKVTKEEFAEELKNLNSLYPSLIRWEDDGIYEKIIVLGGKNYVLVKDGKIKYKGSAVTDQKKEPALREMLEKMFQAILSNEMTSLPSIYHNYVREASSIEDITRWMTKKTVTNAVLTGTETASLNVRRAIEESIEKGIREGIQEGDKIWVYDAIDGEKQETKKGELIFDRKGQPKMTPNYVLRDYQLWNGDEDRMHYVGRVYNTLKILKNLININEYPNYTLKKYQEQLKGLDS